MRVVVIGAAGYVGGELLRLLVQHPEVTDLEATSRSQAGKTLGEVHPALARVGSARFSGESPAEASRGADVVFLSLEHGESSKLMGDIVDAGPGLVIDLAADFRIHDGRLHERYYGAHPAAALVHRFRYGLADVAGTALRGATAIAAPGCFATATQLALYPLRNAPLVSEPAAVGITGSSGAGVHPKPTTHHPARAHNVFAYSVLGHRHEAEVAEQWRAWSGRADAVPRLLTHSGPFVRGIYLTLHAHLSEPAGQAVIEQAAADYRDRPFVRLVGSPPELTHVVGSNDALVYLTTSPDRREVVVISAIDNLVKGAGGQAVQAMNLALGLPETAGLGGLAAYPI
ncbi:MAG: N-acetyl-gamma-glutamyl-phosphate reductase [Gemmatimonadetes bacterium]|nr:N-acetyl-gamma-glutamyl-phosphate reductase [Gemmatimonadota bacterium]